MVDHSSGEDLDRVFKALADPSRRSMLERLSDGPASVGTLGEPLEMSLQAVSKHVAVLEEAGLVRTERIGRSRIAHLTPETMETAHAWLEDYRRFWNRRLDALGKHLKAKKGKRRD